MSDMDADDCTDPDVQTTNELIEENTNSSTFRIFNAHLLESIEPIQNDHFKQLFALILKKPEPVSIEDFFILDNFGTELAR